MASTKVSRPVNKTGSPDTWPTPPAELMEYGEPPEAHLADGRREFETMSRVCAQHGVDLVKQRRALEFGCSNGRVTRWFDTTETEVWGCDIQADKVMWAQENLGPPLRFLVNSPSSSLPFESRYFDFICALSIFTHLQTTHVACLMDLCRLLQPNGILYLTLSDQSALDPDMTPAAQTVRERYFTGLESPADLPRFGLIAVNPYQGDLAQVYMSSEYLRRILPAWMSVVGSTPRAFADLQTAYVLRRDA